MTPTTTFSDAPDSVAPPLCHTGLPIVRQRSDSDCMLCALAMCCGLNYEEALRRTRDIAPNYNAETDALAPSVMRRVAHSAGMALLSSIYFDWRFPGIIGVPSLTFPGLGHALFWDGDRLIDPGGTCLYDQAYAQREAVEYAQRASDLLAVIELDTALKARRP